MEMFPRSYLVQVAVVWVTLVAVCVAEYFLITKYVTSRKNAILVVSVCACLFPWFLGFVWSLIPVRVTVDDNGLLVNVIEVSTALYFTCHILFSILGYANIFCVAYLIPRTLADIEAEEKSEKARKAYLAETAKLASENMDQNDYAKSYYPAMTGGKVYNPYFYIVQ